MRTGGSRIVNEGRLSDATRVTLDEAYFRLPRRCERLWRPFHCRLPSFARVAGCQFNSPPIHPARKHNVMEDAMPNTANMPRAEFQIVNAGIMLGRP